MYYADRFCYPQPRQEKRRSALLESNRPRDILAGLIETMEEKSGRDNAPFPLPLIHRIDRPLHASENSSSKFTKNT